MKKILLSLLSIAVLSCAAFAQQTPAPENKPQDVNIRVQIDPPKAPAPVQKPVEVANEWVDFGKNVGTAMREGLSALTDEANKFAGTDAGRFTMAVIAWKVAGDDAVHLIEKFSGMFIGTPLLAVWTCMYLWILRNKFMTRRVVVATDGPFWSRKKTYQLVNDNLQWSGDDGCAFFVTTVIFAIGVLILLFAVIF